MSESKYKIVIKYKDRSWNKTLRGDDWEQHYITITKFVTKRTGKQLDAECYASIGNTTVSSKEVFESLVTNSDQSVASEFIVHDGPPPANESDDDDNDTSEAKCVIIYRKKVFKFYLPTDDGTVEDNEEAFQEFCDFLEDEVGLPNIDIDEMDDSIEIFSIENKNDIDNSSTQIESSDDFGDVFDDFDTDSDPRQVFYFVVRTTLSDDEDSKDNKNEAKGIELKVNLNDMDCKTKEVTISNVDDRSWDKVVKAVGEACQDLQWTSKYSLCTTHANGIQKFVETSLDFSQFLQENGGNGVTLFAKRVTAVKDKTFILEYNGKMVLWKPAAQFARDSSRAWSNLLDVLEKGLGNIDLNVLHIFYNKKKSALAMSTNELNNESIEQFWNRLKDDKKEAVMHFEICENLTAIDNDEKVGDNIKVTNDKCEESNSTDEKKDVMINNDVNVDTAQYVFTTDEKTRDDRLFESRRQSEIEVEIGIIDGLLTNVNEATQTNSIETDLEFLCDNLRKRQLLVSELSVKENNISKELINSLKIRFEALIKLLKEENYGDDHSIVRAVRKGYNACIMDKNLNLAAMELQVAMKDIRTFDIEEMLTLFNKTIEASKQVEDKDICLLLGRTGAGKSTTIATVFVPVVGGN